MKEDIMEALVQYGVNNRVEERLCSEEEYQRYQQEMTHHLLEIKRLGLSKQHMLSVDRLLSICNDSSAYHGNICYRQGLLDCMELMKKIGLI